MDSKELEQFITLSDDMYRFVMVIMDHMKQPHDYGTGEILNMVEMHTISMIAENPGICVSDIAKNWNRTLSAASRNIDRLHAKGYIEKRKWEGNSKTIHLYPTPKGQQLADLHHDFDLAQIVKCSELLFRKYNMEDLVKCISILKTVQEFYQSQD